MPVFKLFIGFLMAEGGGRKKSGCAHSYSSIVMGYGGTPKWDKEKLCQCPLSFIDRRRLRRRRTPEISSAHPLSLVAR